MKLNEREASLLTKAGFISAVDLIFKESGTTYKQAYDEVERELEQATGKRRYSGYDSFRVQLVRFRKRKNNQNFQTGKKFNPVGK
jgi:hypothetical protein